MSPALAMKSSLVESCVEQLCRKGCRAVWKDIAVLEEGERLPELFGGELDGGFVEGLKGVYNVEREPKFPFTDPVVRIPEWQSLAVISIVLSIGLLAGRAQALCPAIAIDDAAAAQSCLDGATQFFADSAAAL